MQNFVDSDAYKPDLSNFNGGFEMGSHQFIDSSSEFDEIADFERMKVEGQTMNGVNEYWENVNDSSTSTSSVWDIPMLFQMFNPS